MDRDRLREDILQDEKNSRILDVDENWDEHNGGILDYCDNHLRNMEKFPAYGGLQNTGKELDDYAINGNGKPIQDVIKVIQRSVVEPGLNPASGGHLGYIPGGGIPLAATGDYVAACTNMYAGVYYGSPGAVRVENFLINWMKDLIGYPESGFGNLCSGGSIANLTAIICARDAYKVEGALVEKSVIYLSSHAHHCVKKAINMAGLRSAIIRHVKMKDDYSIDENALQKQIILDTEDGLHPFLVVASAGTTDTGVIDPLDNLADVCEKHKLWFHVDAAYGGFFILLDELKDKFKGIERSDSCVLDPHKGLFIPYGLGTILVKNRKFMLESFSYEANYMQDANNFDEQISPSEVSPELTKHFRGMRLWLPLQLLGINPFIACLAEKIKLCRYFYDEIKARGFEVGPYPSLSVMTYRYVPITGDAESFNRKLMEYIREDGRTFVSSTNVDGNFVLRLAVLSFRTHLRTIDTLLEVIDAGVKQIENEH